MKGIDGNTAIVTGGATGIGRASAERFAAEGANVVVADVNVEDGEATVDRIVDDGGEAIFVETDVSHADDVEAMVETAVETYGSLEFAHNNAGVTSEPAPTHEHAETQWDRTVGIDQRGIWLCLKHELPHLLEGGGAAVNTASLAGLWANPGDAPYATAKHGVVGLTKTAALEYAEEGVRVNALCPGVTATPMTEGHVDALVDTTPMNRAGQPAELGAVAVWLCSEEASFITGVAMPVDGGAVNGRV
ncbi:glucose 1-dehydrogenase [Natrarchaeobius sp. A-rgal3]|uniref:glucose 1-dehydrogenase n=1 Tax=Natrarchaeobius versutus TaxID=1679078 RepID=UPI00350EDA52